MKQIILLFTLLLCGHLIYSQAWEKVNQKYYGMKYELPKGWEIDGFGWDDYWEETGSSVCDCAGTINIGGYWTEEELYMVVYPTKYKDSVDVAKRMMVWDMYFDDDGEKSQLKTDHCTFDITKSKWTEASAGSYEGFDVWRLTTKGKGNYYVLYFFALPEVFQKNMKVVDRILESFQPVK